MPFNTDVPQSPEWWIKVLATKLHDRRVGRGYTRSQVRSSAVRPGLDLLDDYLRGDPPLHSDIHSGWAEPFRRFLRMGRLNLADLAVSATSNRMQIRDFRTSAADDELGDVEARNIMRANNLKLVARTVHDFQLGLGDGYTIVVPPDDDRDHSLITAESPLQCITAHDAATGRALAGLKMFRDEFEETDWAYLFLPGRLHVARLDGPTSLKRRGQFRMARDWVWVDEKSDDVPGNRVAMTRFRNRGGIGEFERHLNHLDRVNDKIFNEWWISKIQAFRQRAVMLPDEDVTEELEADGEEREPNPLYADDADLAGIFTSAPDAMWRLPKDAEVWESTPVDVGSLVNSIKAEMQWFAAAVTIPLHTITPDAANGSAQGAGLMREEHVYKIENRRDHAEGGWAETMSLAFLFAGDEGRADVRQIEPIWGPAERYTLAEMSDAAQKRRGIEPDEVIWTDVLQHSPGDVQDRIRPLRNKQMLFLAPSAAGGQQPQIPVLPPQAAAPTADAPA